MNFKEALQIMIQGKKVKRSTWPDSYILVTEEEGNVEIFKYSPSRIIYRFSKDIYFCNEWIIDNEEIETSFADAIVEMSKGRIARLKSWDKKCYLYIADNDIVLHSYVVVPENLIVLDFLATDWIILN